MKITTKHASNNPVTFVTYKRFAVLLFLPSCFVNSLFVGSGNAFFRARKSPEQVDYCHLPHSLSQHLQLLLTNRAKGWLRGRVGGQSPSRPKSIFLLCPLNNGLGKSFSTKSLSKWSKKCLLPPPGKQNMRAACLPKGFLKCWLR